MSLLEAQDEAILGFDLLVEFPLSLIRFQQVALQHLCGHINNGNGAGTGNGFGVSYCVRVLVLFAFPCQILKIGDQDILPTLRILQRVSKWLGTGY